MHIFYIKSLLSLVLIFFTLVALFTMFEIFGRTDKRFNAETLKKVHKLNGLLYVVLSLVIAFLCLDFIMKTRAEPSSRATFHAVFALAVFLLLALKISFIRVYRQYYGRAQMLGLLIALLTFGTVGLSGGYYLIVNGFGKGSAVLTKAGKPEEGAEKSSRFTVKTDAESIAKGKELYETKCNFCHDAYGSGTVVGPGHKGIMKNPLLPVSKRPAIAENISAQLSHPYRDMPSFSYLSEKEVGDLIAFLNTL